VAERIHPGVQLNMHIFKALEGMENSLLATTIPVRELRQFTEALLAAVRAADGVGLRPGADYETWSKADAKRQDNATRGAQEVYVANVGIVPASHGGEGKTK
jgi:hypothetical protein